MDGWMHVQYNLITVVCATTLDLTAMCLCSVLMNLDIPETKQNSHPVHQTVKETTDVLEDASVHPQYKTHRQAELYTLTFLDIWHSKMAANWCTHTYSIYI